MNKLVIPLVVMLILVAGCTGVNYESQEEPSYVTEQSKSETVDNPPGTTDSGITRPSRLLNAHANIVSDSAYEFQSSETGYLAASKQIFQYQVMVQSDPDSNRTVIHNNESTSIWGSEEILDNDSYSEYIVQDEGYQARQIRSDVANLKYNLAGDFQSLHQSTIGREEMLQRTFESANSERTGAFSERSHTYVRFELTYPNRTVENGYAIIRTDGLIKEIYAPDTETEENFSNISEPGQIYDGFDRFALTLRDNLSLRNQTDVVVQRYAELDRGTYAYRTNERGFIDVWVYSSGDSSSCGNNDGDPSYDEDNDRDNDGLCDEG